MTTLFLSILLLMQGLPVQPSQGGSISGILLAPDGRPAAGVRVGAVPQTEALEQTNAGPTLSSIAETDAQGRYKLESVPPGRYYVAAGRLDLPTYFPGSQSMAAGRTVQISPGLNVTGIDFVMNATSAGRADAGTQSGIVLLELPVNLRVDGGGKLPWSSGGIPTTIQLNPVTGTSAAVVIPITATRISLAPPIGDYRIRVEGLPEGYSVASVTYGTTELRDRILSIPAFTGASRSTTTPPPPQILSITLDSSGVSRLSRTGARVTGSLPPNTFRTLYAGGLPSTVYVDGTFEFRNVPAGHHHILTRDNAPSAPALVGSIVVNTDDLSQIRVFSTPALPANLKEVSQSTPAGTRKPGEVPLASLRGRILDSESGMPVPAGKVFLVGDYWKEFELGKDGAFEFPMLLPGRYEIEVQGAGYPTFRRPITVEEQDIELTLRAG